DSHERVGHHGRDKTWKEVNDQYAWIPLEAVKIFISQCDACSNRQVFPKPLAKAAPVAEKLLQQFYSFGPPRILQSDNGKEFVAKVIKNTWTDLVIINGRARHPQTQDLVERGNQTLELALGKWMQSQNTTEWSKGI
ncbi:unnamed protein product, partial [Didymodactylos carnosus]